MTEIFQETFTLEDGEMDVVLASPNVGGNIVACIIEPTNVRVHALTSGNMMLLLPTHENGGSPITMISAKDLNALPLKIKACLGGRIRLRVSGPKGSHMKVTIVIHPIEEVVREWTLAIVPRGMR